jgi:hypothetical protein
VPYLAPDRPELNHLRHLELLVVDYKSPLRAPDLVYHIAHVNERGKPDAWFFDSFLPISGLAPSGNFLYNDVNLGTTRCGDGDFFAVPSPNPATARDWTAALDAVWAPEGLLSQLDECIESLKPALGNPPHKHNIILTIPYPHPNQCMFGPLKKAGPRINFSVLTQNLAQATEQRLAACLWYVDTAIRRWKKSRFRNLHLLGFYWIYESLHYAWNVDDHWLLKELYRRLRGRDMRLFWIPFYSSFNVRQLHDYQGFYFDGAFLQPNHMFYPKITDVATAAAQARAAGAGIEMEYYLTIDPTVDVGIPEKYRRLRNYLNGGVEHGYMTESACAYFIGENDMHKLAVHRGARERGAYHDLFHFVKGDYRPRRG